MKNFISILQNSKQCLFFLLNRGIYKKLACAYIFFQPQRSMILISLPGNIKIELVPNFCVSVSVRSRDIESGRGFNFDTFKTR